MELLTSSNTAQMSTTVIWIGLASGLGALMFGCLFDTTTGIQLLSICLLLEGISVGIAPICPSLPVFQAMAALATAFNFAIMSGRHIALLHGLCTASRMNKTVPYMLKRSVFLLLCASVPMWVSVYSVYWLERWTPGAVTSSVFPIVALVITPIRACAAVNSSAVSSQYFRHSGFLSRRPDGLEVGTHCLIRCVIEPSSVNVLGGTWKHISDMSALEPSPFQGIALCKSTFTYLLALSSVIDTSIISKPCDSLVPCSWPRSFGWCLAQLRSNQRSASCQSIPLPGYTSNLGLYPLCPCLVLFS